LAGHSKRTPISSRLSRQSMAPGSEAGSDLQWKRKFFPPHFRHPNLFRKSGARTGCGAVTTAGSPVRQNRLAVTSACMTVRTQNRLAAASACMTARSPVHQNRLTVATASYHAVAHRTDTPCSPQQTHCDAQSQFAAQVKSANPSQFRSMPNS
jgi:hypothetical protein